MNKKLTYGFLLLIIFLISLMPFNAFHHHQDELHRLAHASNQENHHCELDAYACQDALFFNSSCKHSAHISEKTPDCFVCHFHFSHVFIVPVHFVLFQTVTYADLANNEFTFKPYLISGLLLNKGPPFLNC